MMFLAPYKARNIIKIDFKVFVKNFSFHLIVITSKLARGFETPRLRGFETASIGVFKTAMKMAATFYRKY